MIDIMTTILKAGMVVGLLLLLAWYMKRHTNRGANGSGVRVISRQNLTPKSQLVTVAVGDRVLVLGATDQAVNVLTTLEGEFAEAEIAVASASPALGVAKLKENSEQHADFDPKKAGLFAALKHVGSGGLKKTPVKTFDELLANDTSKGGLN